MDQRLGRTVRVFLVVMAAAGFYRLAVVPWVEPRVRDPQADLELSPEQAAAIRARADSRIAALGDVFPPGSWEREDPIMLESRQMRLLFKEYHALPDGRVNLVPCTLVVLPDRNRAAAGPGRTLVLRAPRGAVLEFDEPLDLKQGRLAKLVGGSLRGQVAIRGLPSEPGAEDDIEIVTRDIELDELQVQTVEAVQFRYGRSTGSGRGLVVRLTPRQGPAGQGPNIGGVESIRLDRDVRMRLEGLAGGLVPGRTAAPAGDASGEPAPPVLVSCRGSLCLNVAADVITLEDKVEVVRTGTGSGTDHLACDLLAILLGRREQSAAPAAGATPAAERGPLEPVEIQAKGTPVVATSTEAGLEARAARLGYEIATRRIVLDGDDPVSLVVNGTEMEARKIDYCPSPTGSLGALVAVGPGRLASRPAGGTPARARWQQWLRMRPDGAGHVVSLVGDAEAAVEAQGRLAASEMHLWLDVVAADAGPAPAAPRTGPDLSRVRPSRLLARGMVEADAEQAEVRTDRLELWFRGAPAAPAAAPAAVAGAAPAPAAPQAAGPAVAPPARPGGRGGRMVASAALVRGLVTMGAPGSQLEEMSMEGQVRLVEQAPAPAAAAPGTPPPEPGLEVLGDQMQVSRAAGPDARAIVSGRPARVRGRGLDLTGPLVEFDRGRGRIAVDGAGRLTLPMARGAGGLDLMGLAPGRAAAAPAAGPPESLDVVWQGRMDFDGRTARFVDRVVTTSGAATVKAGAIDVVFDRAFDLGAAPRPGAPPPEVAKVACGGGVHVESESTTEDGGRSRDRLHARDLVVDRATGDVSGAGPGRLTSTRLGQPPQLAPPGGPTGVAAQPVSAPRPAAGLTYLGVDFQRGLRGNVHRRTMEFHQRVEAIWGPVQGWDQALDPHAAAGLPEGTVTVSSDVLGIAQVPPAPGLPRPTIELAAGGNVLVEGESFTARSARLTWAEAKDLLVFEGDGRADAQLFRQLRAGAQPSSASAGKILFWRAANRVDVEDARYLDLDQLRGGAAPAASGPKAARAPAMPPTQSLPGT